MNASVNEIRSGILEMCGFKLQYTVEGQGTPVFIIGSSVFYPRTFSQSLRQHLQLIFVDHRGFALASQDSILEKFEIEDAIADLELLRKHLGLERIVVLGHSAHGYLALEYAGRFPEHVSHVVVVATGPSHGHHMALAEQNWQEAVCPERKLKFEKDMSLLAGDIEKEPDRRFIHFCRRMSARSWYDGAFDSSELWRGVHVNMPLLDYLFGKVFRDIDIECTLKSISQPILMMMGRFDYQVAPYWSWQPYRQFIKDLTFRVFERSSHYPQMEESHLFDQELLTWLDLKK